MRSAAQSLLSSADYPVLEFGPTHGRLALACLSYLNSGCLETGKVTKRNSDHHFWYPEDVPQHHLQLNYPFVKYAASN